MGFKPSVAIAQTTRFKRKLYSSQNKNNPSTPPATPFNNTSFLIQLQQRREQGYDATPTTSLRFDQYGTMENMIACCSFATSTTQSLPQPPISGPSTSQSSNLITSSSQITDNSSPQGQHGSSQICDASHYELLQQLNVFRSDNAISVMRPKVGDGSEIHDSDGTVLRHRHRQRFVDNEFDTQFADSGSQTGAFCKEEVAPELSFSIKFGR